MRLSQIHLFPLKSARGISVSEAIVEARGLLGDRRWMVVDEDGKFITARQNPNMVLIDATLDSQGLKLAYPEQTSIHVATPPLGQATQLVSIWQSRCQARSAEPVANSWISQILERSCCLVHMADDCIRTVSRQWSRSGDSVSFADGFPLLLIGSASLDELNRRLAQPVTMANFRPNLVVQSSIPFIEDQWTNLRIGAIEFEISKPCTRCVLTTVDPLRGIKSAEGEPLKTLTTFRRSALGVIFGQNLIARSTGVIRLGDAVIGI